MVHCARQKIDPNVDQTKFMPICPVCSDFPLSEENMRKILTDEQYKVLRLKQDEEPNTHPYVQLNEPGNYHCLGCNTLLFTHEEKQTTSVSGLCEFVRSKTTPNLILDNASVSCENCSCHLGFFDQLRLCINGTALQFYPPGMNTDSLDRNNFPYKLSEQEWEKKLGEVAFRVMRFGDTEQAHRSDLTNDFRSGNYFCQGCDQLLFKSENKFQAVCGWPAFNKPATPGACGESFDYGRGFRRIEVHCSNCGGHLGHKFFDAPNQEGGTRYCINGCCLRLQTN